MARRIPDPVECFESDDETYSGYNNFCPALSTADIEEHGIGILCQNNEGSRPNSNMSLKWPGTSFSSHQELVQRRELFRGFKMKTDPRWIKTPRGIIPRPITATCAINSPNYIDRTDCGMRSRTAAVSMSSMRSPTSSSLRPRTDYERKIGTARSYRPDTPDHFSRNSFQDTPRPLSRIRAAYYVPTVRTSNTTSSRRTARDVPYLSSNQHVTDNSLKKKINSPLEDILLLEKEISELFLECCQTVNPETGVKIAQEAQERERKLNFVYANGPKTFPYNTGLTFAVIMHLANQFEANEKYKEALETYQIVSRSKSGVFQLSFRAKISIGNMYMKLGRYPLAVKVYHMALDQVPRESSSYRAKILRNLGIVFFKNNQLVDAISAFTSIMDENPSFLDGLNLMACLYALGCKDDMKTCFEMLLATPLRITKEEKYSAWDVKGNAHVKCLKDGLKFDTLGKMESKLKLEAEKTILMSAQIVSKSICDSIFDGYDWCIEKMRHSQFAHLVGEIQVTKATKLMYENQLGPAIELLKDLQDGSEMAKGAAATNLAFIYLTQQDLDGAEKFSAVACAADCYSSSALVNSGCCLLARGEHAKAKAKFTFAVENDALCFEALYDLGLVNKKMGLYFEALCSFSKLHTIFRDDTLVLYQLALIYEMTGDVEKAMERYQQIMSLEPENALILKQVGKLFDQTGDLIQAHQFYLDSYRLLPSEVDVLIWLSIYNLNHGCPEEKAIKYINLAIQCEPDEVKWQLMVASCHQRSGNLKKAMECNEEIHKKFPDNVECLSRLVKICMFTNREKAKEYAIELKKLDKKRTVTNVRPSSSNISVCVECSTRFPLQSREWHSQSRFNTNQHFPSSICDALDRNAANMLGEEYYPCSHCGSVVRGRTADEEMCTIQRNTKVTLCESRQNGQIVSQNTSPEKCVFDDESTIQNTMELLDARQTPYIRHSPANDRRLEFNDSASISSKLPIHTVYSEKVQSNSGNHHSLNLPGKGDIYNPLQSQSIHSVDTNPTFSSAKRIERSQRCSRTLFKKVAGGGPVGVAHCSVHMSDGDSRPDLHDELQGQLRFGTPRTPRISSQECSDDFGLRMFADSELGADLLPN